MIITTLVKDLKQRKCSLLWQLETYDYDFLKIEFELNDTVMTKPQMERNY